MEGLGFRVVRGSGSRVGSGFYRVSSGDTYKDPALQLLGINKGTARIQGSGRKNGLGLQSLTALNPLLKILKAGMMGLGFRITYAQSSFFQRV